MTENDQHEAAGNGRHQYQDCLYFCGNSEGDWMAKVFKHEGHWRMVYRYRYSNSPDPFDAKDRKSWYHVDFDDDSDETLRLIRQGLDQATPAVEAQYKSQMKVVEFQCYNDDPKFLFELTSQDFAFCKTGKEAEEIYKNGLPKG